MNLQHIQQQIAETGLEEFYRAVRAYYLHESPSQSLDTLVQEVADYLNVGKEVLWQSLDFHLLFRVHNHAMLRALRISSVDPRFDVSILPLNVVLGIIDKFVPIDEDLTVLDPYGIFRTDEKIMYGGEYLASRKFTYAVLANISSFCPVGCAGCYKREVVRTEELPGLKKQLSFSETRAKRQIQLLADRLSGHPEVNTVVLSGGEPLMYSPSAIKAMIHSLEAVPSVKVIRICTAAVYQGLFPLISDDLVFVLSSCEKQFYLNCHVTNERQLQTPEARVAVKRLRKAGIGCYLQMPLQQGINFWREDIPRSAEKMQAITQTAYFEGVIPYKVIVDMRAHDPKHVVPIEAVSEMLLYLEDHDKISDMQRWQAVEALHQQGNVYIYPKPHFQFRVEERDNERVYQIPVGLSIQEYKEKRI